MADNHSKEIRSHNMAQIRSKDTMPELLVRKFLFSNGFRYRLHQSKLPGKPDIVLPKFKTVIFVNGCFWHSHSDCRYAVLPKSNIEYWKPKIERNVKNDLNAIDQLRNLGYTVITIWECELKKASRNNTLENLIKILVPAFS